MSMRRSIISASLLLAGFTISACTAILVPNGGDDGVERCNTAADCTELEDNRHIAQCVSGEGQPDNVDNVCAPAFDEINCHPDAASGGSRFDEIYGEATSNQSKGAYGACIEANKGKQGCAPRADGCDAGLEVVDPERNICDDPDALYPSINPSEVGGVEIAGHDVVDQFCRFYFCDDSFVCDPTGSKWICKPCNPAREFGEGGCGTLFIQGERSPVYTDGVETDGNCNGAIDKDDAEFGTAATPPTP
jgi:hypothetical protein